MHCGGFTRRCPFLSPDEFPVLPSPNGNGNVFLSPDALGQLLGVGRFLAGGEDPRAIDSLQVKWAPGEDGKARVTATGTDGFKLCRTSVSGRSDGAGAALLTRRALAALNTLVERAGEEPVKLSVSGDKLFASAGKDWLWASLRIGSYPDVSEILKVVKNTRISGTVEFKAFTKGVDRSLLAVKEDKAKTAHNATLTVEPGKLSISFSSQEAGSGEALIPFQTNSTESMTIPYNLNVLDDVLSGLRALNKNLETCQISLSSPTSPMAISAATPQGPVLALVMPVVKG